MQIVKRLSHLSTDIAPTADYAPATCALRAPHAPPDQYLSPTVSLRPASCSARENPPTSSPSSPTSARIPSPVRASRPSSPSYAQTQAPRSTIHTAAAFHSPCTVTATAYEPSRCRGRCEVQSCPQPQPTSPPVKQCITVRKVMPAASVLKISSTKGTGTENTPGPKTAQRLSFPGQ